MMQLRLVVVNVLTREIVHLRVVHGLLVDFMRLFVLWVVKRIIGLCLDCVVFLDNWLSFVNRQVIDICVDGIGLNNLVHFQLFFL